MFLIEDKKFLLRAFGLHFLMLLMFIKIQLSDSQMRVHSKEPLSTYVYTPVEREPNKGKELITHPKLFSHAQKATRSNTVGKNASPLLTLLHQRIADNQVYPGEALLLHQSGHVKIGFYLSPDGRIAEARVEKSSGMPSLDNAALEAVNAVGMISEAGNYVRGREYFSVMVEFSL